ncbi:hypothetical protein [Frateuria aurantia]|uniref:Uncharacterized protein n=1 Tax=Frateuria aurantia (strain ATCC 33424 / DSM 6220 / KCTC 2777 / LMG 1558 / NBRC 3245 / NCIMB 13370) TaxID=767434 RepID=H8L2H6_FRAAD|nr:hypothetical protein [Frateuria aurantia]AFC85443.1 hypothetical protein Fraau_0979 [Frateuria aurantia DSM 6220]
MRAFKLILGNRQSVFDLAGIVREHVRQSTFEWALVIRPSGDAALYIATTQSTQMTAHDHPEQIVGVFTRIHDVATIRRDIQRWVDADGYNQKLAPIRLVEGRNKGMWGGPMFREPRRIAPLMHGRRKPRPTCPEHGIPLPPDRDWRGRAINGPCPMCVARRKAREGLL